MASDIDPDESQKLVELFEISDAWQKRITFATGEGTFRSDLRRVHTQDAAACVVFNHSPEADKDNAMLSLAVSSVNAKIPILVPVWSSDNEPFARASGPSTFVFSTKEFRSHLLANSLFAPGLPTLLLNLVRTKVRSARPEKKHLIEYQSGRRVGIQVAPIADVKPGGERLMRLTQRIYSMYGGSILIGVVQADGVAFVPNRKLVVEGTELGIFLREEESASLTEKQADEDDDNDDNDDDVLGRRQLQLAAVGRTSMEMARDRQQSGLKDSARGNRTSSGDRSVRRFSFDFENAEPLATAAGTISDRLPSIERVFDEPDLLSTYCYTLDTPRTAAGKKSKDAVSVIANDALDVIDHILVIAWGDDCDNLADLLVPLRSRALAQIHPVVALVDREPSSQNLKILESFPDFTIILGSGLRKRDLIKANVVLASRALVMTSPTVLFGSESHQGVTHSRDAILCYRLVKQLNRTISCLVEVADPVAAQLLHSGDKEDDALFREIRNGSFCPTPHLIDTLMASSCDAPVLLSAVQQLALLQSVPHATSATGCTNISLGDLPQAWSGRTFGEMFDVMCTKQVNAVPIGLYRQERTRQEYYVYTAPPPSTLLEDADRVFFMTLSKVGSPKLELPAPRS
jgi:hypothetical protein